MLENESPFKPSADAKPAYIVLDGSLLINAPIQRVWPILIDYTAWQDYSSADNLSGEIGSLGEMVLLKKEEPGLETFPSYYARTLKVIPGRQMVWKTFPKRLSAEDLVFFGIVDFKLAEEGDKTRYHYNVYYEFLLEMKTVEDIRSFETEMSNNFERMFQSAFAKLLKLTERDGVKTSAF